MQNTEIIVVMSNGMYDSETLEIQLDKLINKYSFLNVITIGESVMKAPIYWINLGTGKNKIHINGAHHANEWITSYIIMRHIEKLCVKIDEGEIKLNDINLDFVPMVNPDGVNLCIHGLDKVDINTKSKLVEMNEDSMDFSRWKANIRGVDLNRNYNAGFERCKQISEAKSPSYAYYPGEEYESEPETRALVRLSNSRKYDMVLAYHTQGEVIYWDYNGIEVPKAKEYAIMFSEVSGYDLDIPDEAASFGGYKDWFIDKYNKPGFTIECGNGQNPIPVSQSEHIVKCTWPITLCLRIKL